MAGIQQRLEGVENLVLSGFKWLALLSRSTRESRSEPPLTAKRERANTGLTVVACFGLLYTQRV